MSTLTVWKFRTADAAENVEEAFLFTLGEVPSRMSESLPGGGGELLHSNLDAEREARLREIFGDEAERQGWGRPSWAP